MHLGQLHRSAPANRPPPSLQGDSPGYSHGLESLAEPGLQCLEVFNDHFRNHPQRPPGPSLSSARPGRGRYSRRCPRPLLRAPPAWAAVGGAGGRFPRAGSVNSSAGTAAGRESTGCQELPPPRTPARAEAATACLSPPPSLHPSQSFGTGSATRA